MLLGEWTAAEVDDLLGRTVGRRRGRRSRGGDPDALLVRLHQLRVQRRSAREAADRIAAELASDGRAPHAEEVLGEGGGTPAERLRQLADARDELARAGDDIASALRARCRLVATTTRSAYLRPLPRTDFDVVVLAGPASAPEAYYLAGLSTRSVIGVGDAAPERADHARTVDTARRPPAWSSIGPPSEQPGRRRPSGEHTGRLRTQRPRQPAPPS